MKVAEFYIDGEREGWQFTWDERGNKKVQSITKVEKKVMKYFGLKYEN